MIAKQTIAFSPGHYDTHGAGMSQVHQSRLSTFLFKLGVINATLLISAHTFTVPAMGIYQVSVKTATSCELISHSYMLYVQAGKVVPLLETVVNVVRVV